MSYRGGRGYQGNNYNPNYNNNNRAGGYQANQYQALSRHDRGDSGYRQGGPPQQQQQYHGGGRGGQPQGGRQQAPQSQDPRTQIQHDRQSERPAWVLSCYAHARDGRNDLTGDVSFEEVRWMNYQERAAGKPDHQMRNEWQQALSAKGAELERLVQSVRRGAQPPSLGGPAITETNPWMAQFVPAKAGVFGAATAHGAAAAQPTGTGFGSSLFGPSALPQPQQGFGQPPAAPTPGMGFGGAVFGQPSPVGFGAAVQQQVQSGFGVPAPAPGPFGGQASSPWGQPPPAVQPQTGIFNQSLPQAAPAPFAPALPQGSGVFNVAPTPPSPFPSPAPQQQPTGIFAQQQGSAVPQVPPSAPPPSATQATGLSPEELEAFRSPAFQRGSIPDAPPPPELCR